MTRRRRLGVEVADGQQLACAHLDARPAPAQGLETVCNAEDGGSLEFLLQHLLKQHLSLLIQCRGGFVKRKQSGLFQQHACQTHLGAMSTACRHSAVLAVDVERVRGKHIPAVFLRG